MPQSRLHLVSIAFAGLVAVAFAGFGLTVLYFVFFASSAEEGLSGLERILAALRYPSAASRNECQTLEEVPCAGLA